MEQILEQVADRSPTSCSVVAERSPISRRPIADQSPNSFSDSHAPILIKLVGHRSATDRGLVDDLAGTCLRPNELQPGFWTCSKPSCDWFGRSEVPDKSPTSLQPRRDRSGTLLRPLRLVIIASHGEVAKRLQRISVRGLTELQRLICNNSVGSVVQHIQFVFVQFHKMNTCIQKQDHFSSVDVTMTHKWNIFATVITLNLCNVKAFYFIFQG